jgi:hypothetical protein
VSGYDPHWVSMVTQMADDPATKEAGSSKNGDRLAL